MYHNPLIENPINRSYCSLMRTKVYGSCQATTKQSEVGQEHRLKLSICYHELVQAFINRRRLYQTNVRGI